MLAGKVIGPKNFGNGKLGYVVGAHNGGNLEAIYFEKSDLEARQVTGLSVTTACIIDVTVLVMIFTMIYITPSLLRCPGCQPCLRLFS